MTVRDHIWRSTAAVVLACTAGVLAQSTTAPPVFPSPAAPPPAAPPTIRYVIHFEGGNIPGNAARVLTVLGAAKVLPVDRTPLDSGDTICGVYLEKTEFPGRCDAQLHTLADTLNPQFRSANQLQTGTMLLFPDIKFERYAYQKQYDLTYQTDRVAFANDRKIAGSYMEKETVKDGKWTTATFDAFRITIDVAGGPATVALISRLRSMPGVYVTEVVAKQEPPRLNSVSSTSQLTPAWCNQQPPPAEEPYARRLGVDSVPGGDCSSGVCPDVVLIDRPILPHPELAASLDPPPDPGVVAPGARCEDPETLGKNIYHGTHLAGIIGSVKNDVGFIGIHPGAKLFSMEWTDHREADIAAEITARRHRNKQQIYVFASDWRMKAEFANGDLLRKEIHRFENLVAKKVLERVSDMWVVAAGQPNVDADDPLDINARVNRGPMNLGDLRNVLVVTGCESCDTIPTLWPRGHYSRQFVHLAAPADLVISTANAHSFTWARGTSQATAFVAGVISALVSKWPDTYKKDPERIKERLQYTATPFGTDTERARISAGVVNPRVALLDPDKDYLWTNEPDSRREPSEPLGWCAAGLSVLTPEGTAVENSEVQASALARILSVTTSHGREWVVYALRAAAPGVVLRIGPGIPVVNPYEGRPQSRPILKAKKTQQDGTTKEVIVTLDQIEELLVRPGSLKVVSCVSL